MSDVNIKEVHCAKDKEIKGKPVTEDIDFIEFIDATEEDKKNEENVSVTNDTSAEPEKKVIRAKNSHLKEMDKKVKKSVLSKVFIILIITSLTGLFIYAIQYMQKINADNEKSGLIEVSDVKVKIIGTDNYETQEDGSIIIEGITYIPQYDSDGNIVAYADEHGNKYDFYEIIEPSGVRVKYIDIKVNIQDVTIEIPTIEIPTGIYDNIEIPTIDGIQIEIPTQEIPTIEIPVISAD